MSLPSGRRVRRWADVRRAAGSTTSLADTLADIYMGLLAATMAVASALYAARDSGLVTGGAEGGVGAAAVAGRVEAGWLWLLVLSAALVGVVRLARRLGPVGLDAARVRWWLPLPVDRVGLIGPSAWRWPALGAAAAAALGAIAVAALSDASAGPLTAGPVAAGAAAAGLATGAACLALVPAQARSGAVPVRAEPRPDLAKARTLPARRRWAGLGVDVASTVATVVIAVVAVLVLALGPPSPALPPTGALLAVAGIGVVGVVAGLVAARRALPRIPDGELARGGAVAGAATGAVTQLDTRTLGALVSSDPAAIVRRPARLRALAVLPRWLRAPAALVAADALATWRRPGLVLRPVIAVLAVALVAELQGASAWLLPVAVGVGGYVSACAAATGAKAARLLEGLDAHLPMGARTHRVARLLGIWVGQIAYVLGASAVLGAGAAHRAEGGPGMLAWLPLLAVGALGWAAAALRWAYRRDDTGTGPVAPSPFGPVPIGSAILLVTGPDMAVVVSVAPALAIWVGAPMGVLLAATAAIALVLAVIVTTPPPAYDE